MGKLEMILSADKVSYFLDIYLRNGLAIMFRLYTFTCPIIYLTYHLIKFH